MSTLVIVEHQGTTVRPTTFRLIKAAQCLDQPITLLVAGHSCDTVALTLSRISGIEKILVADHPCYAHVLAENLVPFILHCIGNHNFTHVLAAATTSGKNFMPAVAAQLGVAQLSDVIALIDRETFRRPIYAGNVIETIRSHDPIKVLTVRVTAFTPIAITETAKPEAPIVHVDFVPQHSRSKFLHLTAPKKDRPELSSADIVISGGRGLQSKENFERLIKIADRLGAAIGASRAAVDAGMAPNDFQVGQTGQMVAPKLYIAVGVSGAIQHLAGMKDSGVIVAINKDSNAPIFQIADYGLVADIEKLLPEWEQWLTAMGY